MPWQSRGNFGPSDKLHAQDLNNLSADDRTWGGDVNGGGYTLSNVKLVGVSTLAAGTVVTSVFGRTGDVLHDPTDYTPAFIGAVPVARQILTPTGSGLSGGGPLSADVTLHADVTSVFGRTGLVTLTPADITKAGGVLQSFMLTAGVGLSGGGDLSATNPAARSFAVVPDTTNQQVQVLLGGTVVGTRHAVNFVNGAGVNIQVQDIPGSNRLDITVSSSGGAGGGMIDPTTAVGDLIVRGALNPTPPSRLPVGSNGQVLTADTGVPLGVKWAAPAGSNAVASVFGRVGIVVAAAGDYAASQVTNAADMTASYANPSWITSLAWSKITNAPAFMLDPTASKGDLIVRSSSTTTRLSLGADGSFLVADSTQALGVRWGTQVIITQSPWTQDIDAAGKVLKNVKSIGTGGPNITPATNNPLSVLLTTADAGPAVSSSLHTDGISRLVIGCSKNYTPVAVTNTGSPWLQGYLASGDPCPLILQPATSTIEPAGVGVGQTKPQYALDVLGDINLTGIYRVAGVPIASTPGLQSPWHGDIDAASNYLNNVKGIGIGGPAGGQRLYIANAAATAVMESPANTAVTSVQMASGIYRWQFGVGLPDPGKFFVQDMTTGGPTRIQIDSNGYVGLGHPPAYALDVAGDINATGVLRLNGIPVGGVGSVFGRTGTVTAVTGDYSAAQITNAVDQTQVYANPPWLTSLAWSKITGVPPIGVSSVFGRVGVVIAATGDYTVAQVAGAVATSRVIATGTGLTGGGNLSNDLTLSIVPDTVNQKVQILSGGAAIGTRHAINFVSGAGVALSVADDTTNNRVNITVSSSGTGSGGGMVDPTTNVGDLIVRGPSAVQQLPLGATNGFVLTVDTAQALGMRWAAPTGGSGGSQSPWIGHVDAAHFNLNTVSYIGVNAASNTAQARIYVVTATTENGVQTVNNSATNYASMAVWNDVGDYLRLRSYGSNYTVDKGMAGLEAGKALKLVANGAEVMRLTGGHVLVGATVDDTTNMLQVNGTIKSASGGFVFPDGTTQATAVTAATVPVTSVFGRIGAVLAQNADYTAAMVTNAVSTLGSYANPSWITSLAWTKITGAPAAYTDPLTAKGDLVTRTASATTRIPVGTDGQLLMADSAQALGIKWAPAPAQTPWTTNIDGGGHDLTNVHSFQATNAVYVGPFTANFTLLTSTGFQWTNAGNLRWFLNMSGTESGSNSGSDLGLFRYTDASAYLDYVMLASRSSGQIQFNCGSSTFTISSTGSGNILDVRGGIACRESIFIDSRTSAMSSGYMFFLQGGYMRWLFGRTASAEGGSNSGSDFILYSYKDDGTQLRQNLVITRATGAMTIDTGTGSLTVTSPSATFSGSVNSLTYLNAPQAYVTNTLQVGTNAGLSVAIGTNIISWISPGGLNGRFSIQTFGTEGGSNSGSDFLLQRFSDTGTSLGCPVYVARATGRVGINTYPSLPAFMLDVAGDINCTGVFRVGGVPLVSGVTSVFTRTGAVTATTGDYTAAQIINAVSTLGSYADPAWITALNWSKITGAPTILSDPTTQKGDLIVRGAAAPATRLAVGTNNYVLTADSAAALGVKWAAPPALTPWTTNIDGGGFNLTNVAHLSIGATAGSYPLWVRQGADQNVIFSPNAGMCAMQVTNDAVNAYTPLQYVASGHYFLSGYVGIGQASASCPLTVAFDSSATLPQLRISPKGGGAPSASGVASYVDFYSVFSGNISDTGPRRTASIKAQFAAGAWGSETLSFHVGGSGDGAGEPLERMRINTIGQVAIGTAAPNAASALEVSVFQKWAALVCNVGGTLPPNASGVFAGWNQTNGAGEAVLAFHGNNSNLVIADTSGNSWLERMRIDGNGVVNHPGGIRSGSSANWNTAGDIGTSRNNAPATGCIYFGNTGNNYIYFDGGTFNINNQINVNGNILTPNRVGLGTTGPAYKIDIQGPGQTCTAPSPYYWPGDGPDATIRIRDTNGAGGNGGAILFESAYGSHAAIKAYVTNGAGPMGNLNVYMRATTTDTAMIQTHQFQPSGDFNISGRYLVNGAVYAGAGISYQFNNGAGAGPYTWLDLMPSGTIIPQDLGASGNTKIIGWNQASDIMLKRNVQTLIGGLPQIMQLRPITAEWNGLSNTREGEKLCSVIAQEVKEVIPEAVYSYRAVLRPGDEELTELLGLDQMAITCHLILAIQQLEQRLKALEPKVN